MSGPVESVDQLGLSPEIVSALPREHTRRLAACLGVEAPASELPLLWHFAHFTPEAPTSALGPDGHLPMPTGGPTEGLPRRMWVGGSVDQLRPLLGDELAVRRSSVLSSTRKNGRSGEFLLVTLQHDIEQAGAVAVREEQVLAYRAASIDAEPPRVEPEPTPRAVAEGSIAVDPVTLFRFSAVTFNSHRIHFDVPYATEVEGYPGLVVHGPLLAIILAGAAERHSSARVTHFEFQARAPVFAGWPFSVVVEDSDQRTEARIVHADGTSAMTANAW